MAFCTIFGPVRMTNKTLSVREFQDERAARPAEPRPTGQIVGIEKPVPVAPDDSGQGAAHEAVQRAQQDQLDEVGMRLWRAGQDGSRTSA